MAVHGLCPSVVSGGYSSAVVHGLLIAGGSLVAGHGLSGVQTQSLWRRGLGAVWHVHSSSRGSNPYSLHWNVKVELLVTHSCPTLCDAMDWSLPGSSVLGILQARILDLVAVSFFRGSSWPRDWTQVSCIAGRVFTLWAIREALPTLAGRILTTRQPGK